jgi:hypothetical protein
MLLQTYSLQGVCLFRLIYPMQNEVTHWAELNWALTKSIFNSARQKVEQTSI